MKPTPEELATLYVLDELTAGERAACEARLAQDAEFAALVRANAEALEERVRALPRHDPPAHLLEQINARIEPPQPKPRPAVGQVSPSRWTSFAGWGVAAILAIGLGGLWFRDQAPAAPASLIVVALDARQSTVAELPQQENPPNADARFIRLASLAERFWAKPADLPIKPAPMDSGGRGYALFDPATNQGFIAIQQLPAAESGKRYHLWLLDPATGRIREAGVIPLSSTDHGLYFFSLPSSGSEHSSRPGFFVTVEDNAISSSHQPKGKVVLGNDRI